MSFPSEFFWESDEFWDKIRLEVVLALLDPSKLHVLLSNGVSLNLLVQIVHSAVECCAPVVLENHISAALGVKESSFCRDVVTMASIYSQLQNYAFHQLRAVRMFSYFARLTIPRFLVPAFRLSQKENHNEKEILSSYASSYYNKGVIYSVLVQGFIRDYCNYFTVNGVEFVDFLSTFFSKSIAKKPSIIRKVHRGENSKASENLLLYLNRRFPPTPEEIEEEEREQRSTEERASVFGQISEFSENRNESFYSILDVKPTSDLNAIRASYRAQSLKFHPDRVQKTAEAQKEAQERMALVNQAYEILQDPEKRAYYDLTLDSTQPKIFGMEAGELTTNLKSFPVLLRFPLVFGAIGGLFYSGIMFSYASTYKLFRYFTQPGMCWTSFM